MRMVIPCSRQSGRDQLVHLRARMPGSSAPNGSSSSSTRGLRASAWAMASRCCMPPDSALGYLSRCGSSPTASSSACALLDRRAARRADQARQDTGCRRTRTRPARCRARSDAGTPNSAGTRCRGPGPARRAAARRRAGSRRASAAPGRGSGAGRCSCRSPRGRRWRRRRRTAISRLMRSSTIWSPYSTQTLRTESALISAAPARRPRETPPRDSRASAQVDDDRPAA